MACIRCIIRSSASSSRPSGSYYAEGINPVKIMIETRDVRAVRGGTGYAKCGGNYAASSRAGMYAEKKGYTQVLWLDGVERKYVEEVGAMNVMFMIDHKVVTPALLGSVLPGVTRRSCIQLLKDWGYEVEERQLAAEEIFTAPGGGRGCRKPGAAALPRWSRPSANCRSTTRRIRINDFQIGPVTRRLYDELTGIQYGRLPDTHGWTKRAVTKEEQARGTLLPGYRPAFFIPQICKRRPSLVERGGRRKKQFSFPKGGPGGKTFTFS